MYSLLVLEPEAALWEVDTSVLEPGKSAWDSELPVERKEWCIVASVGSA
jgi:hypothetical protein